MPLLILKSLPSVCHIGAASDFNCQANQASRTMEMDTYGSEHSCILDLILTTVAICISLMIGVVVDIISLSRWHLIR